jgi:hypothetical protein
MPIHTELWKVADSPEPLKPGKLPSEQVLEAMIVTNPELISNEWLLIGQQENTGFGGRIDLLALAPDGALVLIELKRDRTPRDVIAQALDYASWVESLQSEDLAAIYSRFQPGHDLANDAKTKFGQALDTSNLNQTHQIIIVATELDETSERIIKYLNARGIGINVLLFQVFEHGDEQFISRTWLLDPVQTPETSTNPKDTREPWNGEFYASFGHGPEHSWQDALEYGFICGGGGVWYSKTLHLLNTGDRVWVNVPGTGYVGVGRVTGRAQPAASFTVNEKSVLEVAQRANYHRELVNDPERCEYFVPIEWLDTVPLEQAIQEIGLFGNQNTVCKPTTAKWRSTMQRLEQRFTGFNKALSGA